MERKVLSIAVIALMFSALIPIASVGGQGIPNPDHIYTVSSEMPETVDPAWAYDTASSTLIQNILEPLCAFDGVSTEAFVAKLADWWPGYGVNPGNTITPSPPHPDAPAWTTETWYFRIRQNVPWHHPAYGYVTPEDVEYSFERGMLMDHSMGPMWMIYESLLSGVTIPGRVYTSYQYDYDDDGTLSETEYNALATDIDNAIQHNATHVWFNLPAGYTPFQQILSQTWSMIMCKQWAIDHDLWKGDITDYTDFLRIWDPPEPGPLMEQPDAPSPVIPGPVAMGTGPYKLAAMNSDPHTGWYTLEKFDDYWGGWPAPGAGGFATYATVKCVEEWPNRKAQFFSTDPDFQADFCAVPRSYVPELHVGGDKHGPTLPGFRLFERDRPRLDALCFTFEVDPTSIYVPLLGPDPKPDMFQDRYLRLAFMHCFNFTEFIEDVYLGQAVQSPVCMPAGTAFFNPAKPKYDINIAKATEYFQMAWGGEVWSKGITVKIARNYYVAKMLEFYIENFIPWPAGVPVDIEPVGVPGSVYHQYPIFIGGWLADFPDPHNWFQPFMHSRGFYAEGQKVTYGLDPASLYGNWYPGATYGPPPYTNALGEYVPEINNSYVDHLIETAIGEDPETRHLLYEELMDIYYAEATQLPMCYTIGRHYERTWINGYADTFNENPIAPGLYFYTIWKEATGPVYEVDISATDTIEAADTIPPRIQVFKGEMRLDGDPAEIGYNIHVAYVSGTVDVWVYVALKRTSAEGTYYFPLDFYISLGPGEDYTATFTWYEDSTMEVGDWTISLYVSPSGVPGGEVEDPDLGNNQADHAQIVEAIEFPQDIDGTGIVDIFDIVTVARAFSRGRGDERWDEDADIDKNGKVDIFDIAMIARMFGKTLSDI